MVVGFSAFILFWNFPKMIYYTTSRPLYYEDLFIDEKKLPNYDVTAGLKIKFQCILEWVLIITNTLLVAGLSDWWLYKTIDHFNIMEIIGITGGIIKIFQIVNNTISRIMLQILRNIIKNDKLFFKDDKFSRTEYEKFLLKSGVSAPIFELNIAEQESRRQFLSFLAGGIVVPTALVEDAFKKENQIKTIKYINLNKYHQNKKPSQEKIKEVYERNKKIFIEEFKSINYAEITPQALTGSKDYNEAFFKQLDIIENKVLDGVSFNEAIKENNLKTISINEINSIKQGKNKKKVKDLPDSLFNKIYVIKNKKSPEIINVNSKYFLAEI
jgi:hypothetical protein